MAYGKYSPTLPAGHEDFHYIYNARGQLPPDFVAGSDEYIEELHFGNYDSEGFDSYGYSALDEFGNYVGIGNGVDREGMTELEYLLEYNRSADSEYAD